MELNGGFFYCYSIDCKKVYGILTWLVVWNMVLFFPIVGMMIQSDFSSIIFQGVGGSTTSNQQQYGQTWDVIG